MHDSSSGRLGCIITWLTIFQACLSRICSDFIKYKTISMAAFFTCADSSTLRLVCARVLKICPRSNMRKDKSSFLEPSTSKAWPTPKVPILKECHFGKMKLWRVEHFYNIFVFTFGCDCYCIQQSRPNVKTNMSKSVQPIRVSFFRSDILSKLVL